MLGGAFVLDVAEVAYWWQLVGRVGSERGVRGPLGGVRGEIDGPAEGEVGAADDAGEDCKRSFGLVRRDQVPCIVDAREGEVSQLAHGAADVRFVDDDVGVAGYGVEGGVGREGGGGDGEGDGLDAEPVAEVVSVAVDEGDAAAEGEEGGELGDLVAAFGVAGGVEGGCDGGGELGVVDGGAGGGLDVGCVEVFEVGAWWEGVACVLGDVVEVSARSYEWCNHSVRARLLSVLADGVH